MDKRKKIIAFSFILLATAVLEFILIAAIWNGGESIKAVKPVAERVALAPTAGYGRILGLNEALSNRLYALQQSDKQYANLLTEPGDRKKMDSVNQLIYQQEEFLRGSIDSAQLNMPGQSEGDFKKLADNIIASYRSILQSRLAVGSLRTAVNLDQKALNPGEVAMLKSQNELQEKNNRIASLEASLKALAAGKSNNTKEAESEPTADADATAPNENSRTLEARIAALTTLNSSLKQDNEKLLKQQNDAPKAAGATEVLLRNKADNLQQKVETLNAELSLAQVDCNLSRVDAAQIISNSKQRKQLLTEASGILTGLANSEDAAIKKKVQDKILRLNQVAANTRE